VKRYRLNVVKKIQVKTVISSKYIFSEIFAVYEIIKNNTGRQKQAYSKQA
jgi:zona occludens toxin (predicted ATPase)